ncbi:RHS repeat-associated core domain-containing protein [Actinacidiphila acidipaludis]|uniref:RHS repeat protein n=1 Tax=Actinacidiphila acidipaludis TaxID=2873382 RepID=A0ABS7QEL5_9ACTN|nr:RHS repeat-associated core domain-containing protein [Streptomyces acidipaludis]MBY8881601.1 RHS repeat protein [Streptomyces acidipaludis]
MAKTLNTTVDAESFGEVPWHGFSTIRLDDALVAKIDLYDGDLLLDATWMDLPVAGRSLEYTNTTPSWNSSPWGNWDRHLYFWQDANGNHTQDGDISVYEDHGEPVQFARNTDGSYSLDSPGYRETLTKNSDGTYTVAHTDTGLKDTYKPNADTVNQGDLISSTDRNGNTTRVSYYTTTTPGNYTYNIGYRLTDQRTGHYIDAQPGPAGFTLTDGTGRTAIDSCATATQCTFTDTAGKRTVYDYDSDGRVIKVTTPEGRETTFTYDDGNSITSFTRVTDNVTGAGQTTLINYGDADPYPTTITDPLQHATSYVTDDDGAVTKVTDALGHTRSHSYDANHNETTAVDAMGTGSTAGNTTTYGWTNNNLTSAAMPMGATATLAGYASHGGAQLPGSLTDPQGSTTAYSYDSAGNLLQVKDTTSGGTGANWTYTYQGGSTDCGGFTGQRCTATDPNGNTTHFAYNTGDLVTMTPPAPLGKTTYTYDSRDRIHTATDGRNITTTYTYDDRDRVTKVATAHTTTVLTYDGDGNLLQQTDASGTTKYTYDALGRENWRQLPSGEQSSLGYDAGGNTATFTDPAGTVVYRYDEANRLKSLTEPGGAQTTYLYDNDDHRTRTTYPGNTTLATTWDNDGRPSTVTGANGSTTLSKYTYAYTSGPSGKDGAKVSKRTDNAGAAIAYAYDTQGRLTRAVETNSGGTTTAGWLYCYDAGGNLQNAVSSGVTSSSNCSGTRVFQYTANAANELSGAGIASPNNWGYDADGNETGTDTPAATPRSGETWTDLNQNSALTVAGSTYTATYSGTGSSERTTLAGPSSTTAFSHTALGLTTATTTGGSGAGTTRFIREPGGTLTGMTTAAGTDYYLTDAQGSVTAVVDNAGHQVAAYTYTPYGAPRTTTGTLNQPNRYTGAYLDPSGLYNLGARSYDPTLGRFTQPDPSGKEANPYAYTAGDPINYTDPKGTFSLSDLDGVIGHISDAKDAYSITTDLISGDIEGAARGTASLTAGFIVGAICEAATGPESGFVSTLGCFAAGYDTSTGIEHWLS